MLHCAVLHQIVCNSDKLSLNLHFSLQNICRVRWSSAAADICVLRGRLTTVNFIKTNLVTIGGQLARLQVRRYTLLCSCSCLFVGSCCLLLCSRQQLLLLAPPVLMFATAACYSAPGGCASGTAACSGTAICSVTVTEASMSTNALLLLISWMLCRCTFWGFKCNRRCLHSQTCLRESSSW